MDPLALGLVALAAVLHATWNILLKQADDSVRYAAIGMAASSLLVVPAAGAGWLLLDRPVLPPEAIGLALFSGGLEAAYFAFLAAAYRRGDLSVVYPLARGSAPILAVAFGVIVLGERLPLGGWLAVMLILAGLLVVQRPWRLAGALRHERDAAIFALLTGATIAAYSAVDRIAVRLTTPWLYAAVLWPICALALWLLVAARARRDRVTSSGVPPGGPGTVAATAAGGAATPVRAAVIGGLITIAAYLLVLAALSRAPLALVAPLRESAVVLASLWGILRLREGGGARDAGLRLAGSGLVLAGAAVLAFAH